ncbi:hypothetical protein GF382_03580 [Candidatus Falkowbacteria bacterium]|nr:hypothetical protein [Candidatus Falkowbacteria bacterium]
MEFGKINPFDKPPIPSKPLVPKVPKIEAPGDKKEKNSDEKRKKSKDENKGENIDIEA